MTSSLNSLRYTTAIAVSLVVLSTSNQAQAQCSPVAGTGGDDVVTCSGTSAGINLLAGNDSLTNNIGSIITGDIITGLGDDAIINIGTITSDVPAGNDGVIEITSGADQVTNTETGVITSTVVDKIGIHIDATAADFIRNAGAIEGTAEAVFLRGNASNLTGGLLNEATGSIIGDSDNSGVGFNGNNAIRVQGDISGGLDNRGLIQHNTVTAIGIEGSGDFTGAINNSGTITGAAGGIGIFKSSGADFTGGIENSGTIHGGTSVGIAVAGSSSLDIVGGITNRSGGVISSDTGSGISIAGFGGNDISGGILNEAGGVITGGTAGVVLNTSSAEISGGINNSGTIEGTGATGIGILADSQSIITGLTNEAGGIISGVTEAIRIDNVSSISGGLNNAGTINGGTAGIRIDNAGLISGGLSNTGTINGETGEAISITGVIFGDLENAGTISGGTDAIRVDSSSSILGSLDNTGTITGITGLNLITNSVISGGIINSGTIEGTGGTAIDLQGLSGATPITITGGRIIGDVIDDTPSNGFSDVTVTGSGFRTEGDFTVSDLVVNAGQDFTISADNVVNLNDMTASAGTLIYELSAASTAELNVTGAGNDIDISMSNIEVFNTDRVINSGDSILIGTGQATVNAGAGQAIEDVTDNLLFFDFDIADGAAGGVGTDNELYLLVSDAANPCNGQFSNNPDGACGALSALTGTSNSELLAVINNIGGAEAEDILEATIPQVDNSALAAARNVTGNTLRLVSDRLTTIRGGGGVRGVSSGDLAEDLQVWGQVFGQAIDQGQRKGIAGFDAQTRGVTVGADTEGLHDNATVGVAFSYADTNVRSDSVNNTRSDINSYNISLYGDYDLSDDTYLIGDIGYTYGDNESTRFNVGGVAGLNADSDYGSHQVEARVIAARDYHPAQYEGVRVTPKVQAHYVRFQNEDISEAGAGGASLEIDSEALHILEFGVGVDVRKDYVQGNGGVLSPEISVGYRYDVIGDAVQTTSTFSAGGPSFRSEGADPDQDTLNLGFGVGYTTPNNMEFTASYDYEYKDEFNSSSAFIRVAAPF